MINRYSTELEISTQMLINAITFAKEGQPQLLSHKDIVNLAKLIKNEEHDSLFPIMSDNPTITSLAKISKITIYFSKQKLTYILEIPLISRTKYLLYEHFPLPVHQNLIGKNLFAYVLPGQRYVALSNDLEKYFTLNEKALADCKSSEDIYICHSEALYSISKSTPSEIKMLTSRHDQDTSNCNIHIKQISEPMFTRMKDENTWLYMVPTPITLTIICRDDYSNTQLSNSGVLQLKSVCIGKTDTITLQTHQTVTKFRNYTLTIFNPFNISLTDNLISTKINFSEIFNEQKIYNRKTEKNSNLEDSESLDYIIDKAKKLSERKILTQQLQELQTYHIFLTVHL